MRQKQSEFPHGDQGPTLVRPQRWALDTAARPIAGRVFIERHLLVRLSLIGIGSALPMPMWKNLLLALLAINISAAITMMLAKGAQLIADAILASGVF